jgi:hypothetical protein
MRQWALSLALLLMSLASFAQTTYTIPDGTAVDYIYYSTATPYANLFFDDFPATVNGESFQINVTMHYVQGSPAASYGTIQFVDYGVNYANLNNPTYTNEALTGINFNPFSASPATATASFSGTFNGTLTFNLHTVIKCGRYCHKYSVMGTVNGVSSNFTF